MGEINAFRVIYGSITKREPVVGRVVGRITSQEACEHSDNFSPVLVVHVCVLTLEYGYSDRFRKQHYLIDVSTADVMCEALQQEGAGFTRSTRHVKNAEVICYTSHSTACYTPCNIQLLYRTVTDQQPGTCQARGGRTEKANPFLLLCKTGSSHHRHAGGDQEFCLGLTRLQS